MNVEDGIDDRFPVGLRVLVVDDDQTCLKVLENLLLKCKYNVTTTNQSTMALQLLRENKDKFDLVISDVYMPDMDGFKLLELIGLEMDLPVIMLSGSSSTDLVMQGVKHGAVDYLIKPVRLQELKNIWQHVLRKGKSTNQVNLEIPEPDDGAGGSTSVYRTDNDSRKRKDQGGGDSDDNDEDEDRDAPEGDTTSQKKPRVIWSADLHRKFVAAVDELGIDKAFPKKILQIMNVEGLTRENVASHLQKYRLYLRRISDSQSQQIPVLTDTTYLGQSSLLGRGLGGPNYFVGSTMPTSLRTAEMLNRLTNAASLNNINSLASASPILQPASSGTPIANNSISTISRYQPLGLSSHLYRNSNSSLLLGNATSTILQQELNRRNSVALPGNHLQLTGTAGGLYGQSSSINALAPSSIQMLGGPGSNASHLLNSNTTYSNGSWNDGVAAGQSSILPSPFKSDQFAPSQSSVLSSSYRTDQFAQGQSPMLSSSLNINQLTQGPSSVLSDSFKNDQLAPGLLSNLSDSFKNDQFVQGQSSILSSSFQNDQFSLNPSLQSNTSVAAAAARIQKDLEYVLKSSLKNAGGHGQPQMPIPDQEGFVGIQNTVYTPSSNHVMSNSNVPDPLVPTPLTTNHSQTQGIPVGQPETMYSRNINDSSSSFVPLNANHMASTALLPQNDIHNAGSNISARVDVDYNLDGFSSSNSESWEDMMNRINGQVEIGSSSAAGELDGLDDLFRTHM